MSTTVDSVLILSVIKSATYRTLFIPLVLSIQKLQIKTDLLYSITKHHFDVRPYPQIANVQPAAVHGLLFFEMTQQAIFKSKGLVKP